MLKKTTDLTGQDGNTKASEGATVTPAAFPLGSLESRAAARALLHSRLGSRKRDFPAALYGETMEELGYGVALLLLKVVRRAGPDRKTNIISRDQICAFRDGAEYWFELERFTLGSDRVSSHCAMPKCDCSGTGGSHRQIYPEPVLDGVRLDRDAKKLIAIFPAGAEVN